MNKMLLTAILAAVIGSAVTIGVVRFGRNPDGLPSAHVQQPMSPAAVKLPEPPADVPPATPEPAPVVVSKPSPMPAATKPVTKKPVHAAPPAGQAKKPEPQTPPSQAQSKPQPAAPPAPVETAQSTPPAAAQEPPAAEPTPEPRQPRTVTIPAGTLVTVRLQDPLSSEANQPGDAFAANLIDPFVVGDLVIAEKGARVNGRVVESARSGKVKGVARLSVELESLTSSDGQKIRLTTEPVERVAEKSTREDAAKIGIGAAIGAAIGAIAGGGKGAAIGAAAGGGAGTGAVLATRGKAAEFPSESRLTFRIAQPVTVTEKLE